MRAVLVFVLASLAASVAVAQQLPGALDFGSVSQPYGVREITFDNWCQQTQRYSEERCRARQPADVKAFEDYRDTFERYELDYLRQNQRARDLQDRTNRDPTDRAKSLQDSIP